jgi:sugar-specific transcriptional regulator TrmB
MRNADELLVDIRIKISKLITLYDSSRKELEKLEEQKKELLSTIEEQKRTIENLNDKNNVLTIAQSVKQNEGNAKVKNKIDELVREIDKCIGLLNK